jgi:amino acid permease
MLFKLLVLDFLSENIWSFIAYILIILAFFPIKSVILPNIYGMMFDQIKTISKFTDIYNFRENFAKMNFPGALVALIVSWIVVILSSSMKTYFESLLIPGYFTYLRQLLFAKTVNSYQAEYRDVKKSFFDHLHYFPM